MIVVHVQTVIMTTFGLLDEAGNVNPQRPIQLTASILSSEVFAQVYQTLMQAKTQMQTESEKQLGHGKTIRPDYSTSGS